MVKIIQIFFLFILTTHYTNGQDIIVGAEQTDKYFPSLKNKRVGVICNQTSTIKSIHIVDSMLSAEINIVAIFAPEHGFRGNADAGEYIENNIDSITGLPIISLYGKNKKPKKKQLEKIDILVFDIQDVGARFYTYISTLHYIIEACSENNLELLILDRPNPNGHYVDGPLLESTFKSFVGIHPVPITHAMTIGEYARMICGENWVKNSKDNTPKIIMIKNYKREMHYDLPIKPSPNLPNSRAINLYPSLCLFEGTNISVGRGTEHPFQHIGAPYFQSSYSFTPKSGAGSKYPKYEEEKCFGTDLRYQERYLTEIDLSWLIDAYNNCPDKNSFFNSFFDKLAGTDKLRKQIIAGKTEKEIKNSWKNGINDFKKIRKKYLIY